MFSDFRLTKKQTKLVTAYLDHGEYYQAAIDAGFTSRQAQYAKETLFQEIPVQQAIIAAENAEFADDVDDDEFFLDSGLTPQMSKFALEASQNDNLKEAALSANYSKEYASEAVRSALQNPLFLKAIDEHTKAQIKRISLTKDKVLAELMKIAFFDIKLIFDEFGKLAKPSEYDEDTAAVVSEYSENEHKFGVNKKVKAHDKMKALQMLGQHLGLFKDDDAGTPKDDEERDISDVELMAKALAFVQQASRSADNE